MNRDVFHNLSIGQSIVPVRLAAPADGTGISLAGYESAVAILNVGAIEGTDTPTYTFKLQHSDVLGSGYVDVTTAHLIDGESVSFDIVAANDNQVHVRGYIGGKAYLRWICSAVTGTDPFLPTEGAIVRGNPRHAPTS
jgi:hypothetical protein